MDKVSSKLWVQTYQKAKQKVISILKNKEKPTLKFEMSYKNTKISIESVTNDEQELNKVFDTIDKARDLAINELERKETPEMTNVTIIYNGDWMLDSGMNWKPLDKPRVIKFYEYDKKTGKWKKTRDWSER